MEADQVEEGAGDGREGWRKPPGASPPAGPSDGVDAIVAGNRSGGEQLFDRKKQRLKT